MRGVVRGETRTGRSNTPLGSLGPSFWLPKSLQKSTKSQVRFFVDFLADFGSILVPKWALKLIKNQLIFGSLSASIFSWIFYALGLYFGSILAPKIDPGGARARKGRPSILNNPPMKIMVFRLWGCPGAPKIVPGSASKIQCIFYWFLPPKCSKNEPKMRSKMSQKVIKK